MKNKKVLICIDWFLPAYKAGGPIQSISNMVNHLKNHIEFWIFTSNYDIDKKLDINKNDLNRWIKKDGFYIRYSDKTSFKFYEFRQLMKSNNFDIIYMNSLFSINFTLIPLLSSISMNIKRVLAPRGMLGKGALEIKPLRKKYF